MFKNTIFGDQLLAFTVRKVEIWMLCEFSAKKSTLWNNSGENLLFHVREHGRAELGTHNFFVHVSVNPIFFMELWKKLHDYVAEHVIVHENVNKQLHEPVNCAWTVRWWSFHNAHMYSCSANSGIGSIAWSTWSVIGPFLLTAHQGQ